VLIRDLKLLFSCGKRALVLIKTLNISPDNAGVADLDHFDADPDPTYEKKPDADPDPIMLHIKFCNKIFLLKNSL
jgi:hypothetical protein